jgi:hypothetical protein
MFLEVGLLRAVERRPFPLRGDPMILFDEATAVCKDLERSTTLLRVARDAPILTGPRRARRTRPSRPRRPARRSRRPMTCACTRAMGTVIRPARARSHRRAYRAGQVKSTRPGQPGAPKIRKLSRTPRDPHVDELINAPTKTRKRERLDDRRRGASRAFAARRSAPDMTSSDVVWRHDQEGHQDPARIEA